MNNNANMIRTIGRTISWQAWWAEWLLRLIVKRKLTPQTDLVALRGWLARADHNWFRAPANVRRAQVDTSGVVCEWVDAPDVCPERVILYLHGGGFAVHLPSLYAEFTARLGQALEARVLMVDYRLTPECPFPAAAEDCHDAYRWLLADGFAPQNIIIAGDSAGGNLTLATLLRIKAAGEPMPACALAISPAVDLTMSSPSIVANEQTDALLRPDTIRMLVAAYAEPSERCDPLVSPLFGNLAGLPPILLQAGTREILQDEAVRFGAAACAVGVHAEVELWQGMQHCFQLLKFLPESRHAIESISAFVMHHTSWLPKKELPPWKN